jgi:uncharacterized protein YoxC
VIGLTAVDWSIVALIGCAALVLFVIAGLITKLYLVINSVRLMLDGITQETVPLIGEVGQTVRHVNKELDRADAIVNSVQRVAQNVEQISDSVKAVVTNPAVKALAFFAGARKAAKTFGEGKW